MVLRTIFIGSLWAVFLAGCGSKTTSVPRVFDRGLAQPPPLQGFAPTTPQAKQESHSLAAGTVVPVRNLSVIDSSVMFPGYMMGVVESNVNGSDGRIAIPAGSHVAIIVRESSKMASVSILQMGLYSINIGGHQYVLSNGVRDSSTLVLKEDAGKGPGHSSVHLTYGEHLAFKLDAPVELR